MGWLAITPRWLRRRTRYFVILVVLGVLSVLLLVIARYSSSPFTQNLCVDLGAGLIAVIATFFVLNPLFEQIRTANTQEHPKLDQNQYIEHMADSKRVVRILETWIPLLNTRRERFLDAVADALKNGAKAEILLLSPDSRATAQRTDELQGENAREAIMENLYHLHHYQTDNPTEKISNLSVRIYSGLPPVQLYQWDDKAFLSFFPIGRHSEETPQLETSIKTPWGD